MLSTASRAARLGVGLALLLAAILVHAQVAVPALTARVTDLTGTLSGEAVTRIEAKLADLEAKKGSQIAVLIVPTTQPEDIDQFGIRVEDAWKLGRKGVDDGAYLIVAKNDRRVRIEVGYGLEGALPDAISNRIITETITPHFKLGDYDGGGRSRRRPNDLGRQRRTVAGPRRKWEHHSNLGNLLPLLLVVVFVASGVLRALFGRLFGSLATGGLTGGIAWLLSHFLPIGLGAGIVAFLFAMLAGSNSRGWSAGSGWGGGFVWRPGGRPRRRPWAAAFAAAASAAVARFSGGGGGGGGGGAAREAGDAS